MTRQQGLQTRLRQKDEQLGAMKSVLHKMQHGSDTEALELFARLRTGESMEELANIRGAYSSSEQKSPRANDAIRSAHFAFPRSDPVQPTVS